MTQTPRIKLFADVSSPAEVAALASDARISGFTTNPSLMRKAGVGNYVSAAKEMLALIPAASQISFEVLADDLQGMEAEAREIASWGGNVYVKIPVTTTTGESTCGLVKLLSDSGIKVNVTAVFTPAQIREVSHSLCADTPAVISIFAGRIADTGVDPADILRKNSRYSLSAWGRHLPHLRFLWASTRELINIRQAEAAGCDIITLPPDLIRKLPLIGRDLTDYSLETVRQFRQDAVAAGFQILNPPAQDPRSDGWVMLPSAEARHYFRAGRSLCGMYALPTRENWGRKSGDGIRCLSCVRCQTLLGKDVPNAQTGN